MQRQPGPSGVGVCMVWWRGGVLLGCVRQDPLVVRERYRDWLKEKRLFIAS